MKYFSLLFIYLFLISCSKNTHDSTFRVALRYLPQTVEVRGNQINTNVYILSHLYYPMFSINNNGELESYFLDISRTSALSDKFNEYVLCLKDGVRFSNGEEIQVADLAQTIKEIHNIEENLKTLVQLKKSERCIQITLEDTDYSYLKKLTGISSTILKFKNKDAYPLGKGKYKIKDITSEKISLIAEDDINVEHFKNIDFIKFKNTKHKSLNNIDDWNHVTKIKIPEHFIKKAKEIVSPTLKTYAVVINYNDINSRKIMNKCFNREGFKKQLSLKLVNTSGFLPNGLAGSNIDYKTILKNLSLLDCSNRLNIELDYYNFIPETWKATKKFFYENEKHFPVNIRLNNITGQEMAKLLFSGREYMALIGFDTSMSGGAFNVEPSVFFESFIRDTKRIINNPLEKLKALVHLAAKNRNKNTLYAKAHEVLLKSYHLIPLGQVLNKRYYNKNLTNMIWFERFSSFPQIDKLRYK